MNSLGGRNNEDSRLLRENKDDTNGNWLTGPATKITNLGALKIVLGVRHFVYYLVFVIVFAMGTGWVVNLHGFGGGMFYNGIIRFLIQRVHGERLFYGAALFVFSGDFWRSRGFG